MTTGLSEYVDPAITDEVLAEARAFNVELQKVLAAIEGIEAVPAETTRQQRRAGGGPLPAPVFLAEATDIALDGRSGPIPVRVIRPSETPVGIYIHIHGGGHTLGAHDMQDVLLKSFADEASMVVASIGYRLAPEHPYPAGPDDCEDAAAHLIREGARLLGTPPLFTIGGESAGANLSLVTLLRLRDRQGLAGAASGANLVYGGFDLTSSPSVRAWTESLVLSTASMRWFTENYVGHLSIEDRQSPDISPIYADLTGLPPALFTIGTRDPLLDDSLFMFARWRAAGGSAQLAVYPEGVHGFNGLPTALARIANRRQVAFLREIAAGDARTEAVATPATT